jgi:hypothetical protein
MKLLSLVGLPDVIIFSDPLTEAVSSRFFSFAHSQRSLIAVAGALATAAG